MTSHNSHIEILGGPERRRRWTSAEKLSMVQETYETGATVSLVARRHGIAPNQLFGWRKRFAGLMPSEVKRLRQLEEENAKLEIADITGYYCTIAEQKSRDRRSRQGKARQGKARQGKARQDDPVFSFASIRD